MATHDGLPDCPNPECTQPVPDGAEWCEAHAPALPPRDAAADMLRDVVADALTVAYGDIPARPAVVCLCGSTRFAEAFRRANLAETLAGRIVLTIGCDMRSDGELFDGVLLPDEVENVKARLDVLHMRKIDLADEVLVLNVGDYLGESTAREVRYARYFGKRIRWLEPHNCGASCHCRAQYVSTALAVAGVGGIPGVLSNEGGRAPTKLPQPVGELTNQGMPWTEYAEAWLHDVADSAYNLSAEESARLAAHAETLAREQGFDAVQPAHVYAAWRELRPVFATTGLAVEATA